MRHARSTRRGPPRPRRGSDDACGYERSAPPARLQALQGSAQRPGERSSPACAPLPACEVPRQGCAGAASAPLYGVWSAPLYGVEGVSSLACLRSAPTGVCWRSQCEVPRQWCTPLWGEGVGAAAVTSCSQKRSPRSAPPACAGAASAKYPDRGVPPCGVNGVDQPRRMPLPKERTTTRPTSAPRERAVTRRGAEHLACAPLWGRGVRGWMAFTVMRNLGPRSRPVSRVQRYTATNDRRAK